MANWLNERSEIYVGDAFGNPRQAKVGVVKVNNRTTVGIQFNPDNPRDQPDYTLDAKAISETITVLREQLSELIKIAGSQS